MIIKQISVFIENKTGRLAAILEVLAKNGINISALSLADTEEYGVLRLITDNPELSVSVLKETGVIVKQTDVIAVPIDNTPGGLSKKLAGIAEKGISVDYMYAFVGKTDDKAMVVLKTSDAEAAEKYLSEN